MSPFFRVSHAICQSIDVHMGESFVPARKEKRKPPICALCPCGPRVPVFAPRGRNSYLSARDRHSQEDALQRRIGGSPDIDSFTVV